MSAGERRDEEPRELAAERVLEAIEGRRAYVVDPRQRGAMLEEEVRPPPLVDREGVLHTGFGIDAVPRQGDPWTEAKACTDAAPRSGQGAAFGT
jgi:hypothetical protein